MVKYERRKKCNLPPNITRSGGQGGRGVQMGKVTRAIKSGFNLLKRLVKRNGGSKVTKKVAGWAIKCMPALYEKVCSE